jgi:hypothetical protein
LLCSLKLMMNLSLFSSAQEAHLIVGPFTVLYWFSYNLPLNTFHVIILHTSGQGSIQPLLFSDSPGVVWVKELLLQEIMNIIDFTLIKKHPGSPHTSYNHQEVYGLQNREIPVRSSSPLLLSHINYMASLK